MRTSDFRKRHGLSQIEFAVLMGVPKDTIKNHEQGRRGAKREPNPAMNSLMILLEIEENRLRLLEVATQKTYESGEQCRAVLRLIDKIRHPKTTCASPAPTTQG